MSVCNGGMSVSGDDSKYGDIPVMASGRDGMRNQSWTDAQQPCYVCETVIVAVGICNQAMIRDVSF